jgi:hypothetical protein
MKKILHILAVVLVVWMALSYINIICHNAEPNPTYWAWNFFTLIFR